MLTNKNKIDSSSPGYQFLARSGILAVPTPSFLDPQNAFLRDSHMELVDCETSLRKTILRHGDTERLTVIHTNTCNCVILGLNPTKSSSSSDRYIRNENLHIDYCYE